MAILLFPGRHLLTTRFQEEALAASLGREASALPLVPGGAPAPAGRIDLVVYAITSANQAHSRYNPIAFHARAVAVDRFARRLKEAYGVPYRIVGVPHYGHTERFVDHLVKSLDEELEGALPDLTPHNTVVLCSTPALIADWQERGFAVHPAEWSPKDQAHTAPLPIELVKALVAAGEAWAEDEALRAQLHPASFSMLQDFPEVPTRLLRLWRDPLLNESGSLTETRDYQSYARAMDDIIPMKFAEIRPGIRPGRIVDEGCADGGLLVQLAKAFPDADLIGIDLAAEFVARCRERQRAGEFGQAFVHVHQRNLLEPIFEPGSIDTTICNSTLHELWSYGDGEATVRAYLAEKTRQLRPGGRLVVRDVVGFPGRQEPVWLLCPTEDGANEGALTECPDALALRRHLEGLSTHERFKRFARDFKRPHRADAQGRVAYEAGSFQGQPAFQVSAGDAWEFAMHKDYPDSWEAEMHESFCFWGFEDWKAALVDAGLEVLEDPNHPERGSRAYCNPWRVQHHFGGKVAMHRVADGPEAPRMPFLPTNMVLIAQKPLA